MSHHDHHEHDHHHHDHGDDHDHHHTHSSHEGEKSFDEKFVMLLDHWIKHNDDHAGSYRDWAAKAADHGFSEAADLLNEAAEMTLKISEKFEKAAVSTKKQA